MSLPEDWGLFSRYAVESGMKLFHSLWLLGAVVEGEQENNALTMSLSQDDNTRRLTTTMTCPPDTFVPQEETFTRYLSACSFYCLLTLPNGTCPYTVICLFKYTSYQL